MNNEEEKRRLEDEKTRFQQEKETIDEKIIRMETELRYLRSLNASKFASKGKKIAVIISKRILPYVMAIVLTTFGFAKVGRNPFKLEKLKANYHAKKYLTEEGVERYSLEQVGAFPNETNLIVYYGKWHYKGNDTYRRQITTFKINETSKNKIKDFLKNNNVATIISQLDTILEKIDCSNLDEEDKIDLVIITYLENILGEKVDIKFQTSTNLSQEEIQSSSYIEAIYYALLESYGIVNQTEEENYNDIESWSILIAVLLVIIGLFNNRTYTLSELLKEINEKYSYFDTKELEEKLNSEKEKIKSYSK